MCVMNTKLLLSNIAPGVDSSSSKPLLMTTHVILQVSIHVTHDLHEHTRVLMIQIVRESSRLLE